ncbi:MAG: DUF2062 domain-containing protein [Cyclobacteriaceae bacterium]
MSESKKKNLWDRLIVLLKSGTSPKKLAFTCAIGVVVGTFPVVGVTTLICFGIAILFRLNIAILQLINYIVYPLQLLLILPFIKLGTYLFNINPLPYTIDELIVLFQTSFFKTMHEIGLAVGLGIGVWLLTSIPVFIGIYAGTLPLFKKWKLNQRELKSQ